MLLAHNLITTIAAFQWKLILPLKQGSPHTYSFAALKWRTSLMGLKKNVILFLKNKKVLYSFAKIKSLTAPKNLLQHGG